MNAIFVCAYNRPKYLTTCLQALFRCSGIDRWKVFVSIDNASIKSIPVFTGFDVRWIFRHEALGNKEHVAAIFEEAISLEVDNMLFIEDDHLLSVEAIRYASASIGKAPISSLYKHPTTSADHVYVSDLPNLFTWAVMRQFVEYYRSGEYKNDGNPLKGGKALGDEAGYDHILYTWALHEHVVIRYADRHYALNFGVNGVNHHYGQPIEDAMFSGPRQSWIQNILRIREQENGRCSFRPEDIDASTF